MLHYKSIFTALFFGLSATSAVADHPRTGAALSEAIGPYFQTNRYDFQVSYGKVSKPPEAYLKWKADYHRLTTDEKIAYCVEQLKEESWHETQIFGPTETPCTKPPESAPRLELFRLGGCAIPALIAALESRSETKIYASRHFNTPWLVQDAAMEVIEQIASRHFHREPGWFSKLPSEKRAKIVVEINHWWNDHRATDEVTWAKEVLIDGPPPTWRDAWLAVDSLFYRVKGQSVPWLVKGYFHLEKRSGIDEEMTDSLREEILRDVLFYADERARDMFTSALNDKNLALRLAGARGLRRLCEDHGIHLIIAETFADKSRSMDSSDCDAVIELLASCGDMPEARDAILKCLHHLNPYFRSAAVGVAPELRMEQAARTLPELFDDPFITGQAGTDRSAEEEGEQDEEVNWTIAHDAASAFSEMTPDAPTFSNETAHDLKRSLIRIRAWYKRNGSCLVWNETKGQLVLPEEP